VAGSERRKETPSLRLLYATGSENARLKRQLMAFAQRWDQNIGMHGFVIAAAKQKTYRCQGEALSLPATTPSQQRALSGRHQRDRINVEGRAAKQGKSRLVHQKQIKSEYVSLRFTLPAYVSFCPFPGNKFSVSIGFDQFLFETKVQ
jgi:hypothetical protein